MTKFTHDACGSSGDRMLSYFMMTSFGSRPSSWWPWQHGSGIVCQKTANNQHVKPSHLNIHSFEKFVNSTQNDVKEC